MSEINDPEITKEELLIIINNITKKVQTVQVQIDKLDLFYKENLIDEGENISNQTLFKNIIVDASKDAAIIQGTKDDVEKFKTETLIGTDEIPSIKTVISDSLNDIKIKQEEIVSAYQFLLENAEGRDSIKTQITNLKNEIEQFKKDTLNDSEGKESTKTIINNLITKTNQINADSQKINSDIEGKHFELNAAQKLILEDEEDRESIKTQIIKIKDDFSKNLTENEKEIRKLRSFYNNVFEKIVDEETLTETPGLKATVESLANRLEKLTSEAENKLFGLTDSSLQHAFASRALEYTKEFKKLQQLTFWLTLALVGDIILFGTIQLFLKSFDWHLLIYQFSIAGALVFAIWMYNRNQKIAKKLAEEYQHKASLTEAMTGYRALYTLEHKDAEYLELFNSIKDQLNTNPSKLIDTFLNLKSPHEELSGSIKGILNTENLNTIAEQVKLLIKKDPIPGI